MRIVVSGTHASGKSTLISDFSLAHPEYEVLPDPFELLDEAHDMPGASMMAAQLRLAAGRLLDRGHGDAIIAERGPIDFLAYLLSIAELSGRALPADAVERMTELTAEALASVDMLVVLPLTVDGPLPVGSDEHLELRQAMNDVLLELIDDPDVTGGDLQVLEIVGPPGERLAALERAVLTTA